MADLQLVELDPDSRWQAVPRPLPYGLACITSAIDMRLVEMQEFCLQNFGDDGGRWRFESFMQVFYFETEKDRLFFYMRFA